MKNSRIEKLWIGMFFSLLIGLPLLWLAAGKALSEESYENRAAVKAPVFSLAEIESYPAAWEAYYNDHLPFRNQLIRCNSRLEYDLFQNSANQNVIRGKEGWLFYNSFADDNPIEAYKGMGLFTQEELAEITGRLLIAKEHLAEQGIEFVLLIAPNKERVYAEMLPDYYGAPAQEYQTGQLVSYVREHSDIRVVYPYEELLAAKERSVQRLYYRLDTHWNELGAYVGTQALVKELGTSLPEIEELTLTETEPTICDLADMLNLRTYLNRDSDWRLSGYDRYHLITERHELTGVYAYHCQGADPRKLFVVRDSFADAMDDALASCFDESYMVHYSSYTPEQVMQEQPDIYVYETVERRISQLLTFPIIE